MSEQALPRLFVLGDSISMQYGPFLEANLRGVLGYARKEDVEKGPVNLDIPAGANGGDSTRCLKYLQFRHERDDLKADILLLNCGLHDVKCSAASRENQVPIERYRQNLTDMVALARAMDLKLVWVRTTPVCEAHHNKPGGTLWRLSEDVDRYNAAADSVMRDAGVPEIDLHALTLAQGPIEETSPDGRHFTPVVQRAHAAYIAGWLTAWWMTRRD
ncbi:MAG: hypothetical protein GC164_10915 [Phycisphaera sp.]|nr:hypothetical protein [Phycisphaera sp.]